MEETSGSGPGNRRFAGSLVRRLPGGNFQRLRAAPASQGPEQLFQDAANRRAVAGRVDQLSPGNEGIFHRLCAGVPAGHGPGPSAVRGGILRVRGPVFPQRAASQHDSASDFVVWYWGDYQDSHYCTGFVLSNVFKYCKGLYQERPLKMLDWLNGTRLPVSVIVLELKFGLMVTVALFPPLVSEMKICAEIPIP